MSLFFVHAVFAVTRRGVTSPSFASWGEAAFEFEKNKNNRLLTTRLLIQSSSVQIHKQKKAIL